MELIINNLSKRFGEKLILDHLSFSMKSGDFMALVGSSGSGKSTILRLVAGLDQPSSGSITVDGTPVSGPGPDRGMVFQKYSLYPWLNAAENVAFGMRLQRMKAAEIKERTAYFLEVVGLSDAATKLPRELSGGMQQRVAIARALATNPSILLLDEPCSAIDPPTREHLLKVMRDQAEAGQTLLVSSHDWGSALDSYDQVVVMDGQILANGSPNTVREKLSDLTCMMGSHCCG